MTASVPVAVVILNWNGADDTLACLRSLAAQTCAPQELLVVDNGSEDNSVARLRAEFPELKLQVTGVNLGFAEGVNRGIEATTAPWVWLLNNDVTLPPHALAGLFEATERSSPEVGMLQPLLVFRDRPEVINSSGAVIYRTGNAADRHFEVPLSEVSDLSTEPFAVTAGAGLYRREMLEAVALSSGYFDRTHFMYYEDVDLGWRARLAGWTAAVEPGVRVVHGYQSSSTRQPGRFVERLCKLNRIRMLAKNASSALLWRFFLGPRPRRDLAWMIWHEGPKGALDFLKALYDGFRARPAVSRLTRLDRAELEGLWLDDA